MADSLWLAFCPALMLASLACEADAARVSIAVIDKATGEPMPARIHLRDASGKPHQPADVPFWRDHLVCAGNVEFELGDGDYAIEVERGPEFSAHAGKLTVGPSALAKVTIALERLVDLAADGWWSGDMHVHRAPQDAGLLMRAEDLHVGQFITWWNKQNLWGSLPPPDAVRVFDGNRFCNVLAGEDEREGGALLFFNLPRPLDITKASQHFPSSLVFAAEARRHPDAWIDMEKPFWWDFPLWLASGLCDSVGLANNHMQRSGMHDNEAWGRPRDQARFPSPHGNGLWTQEIYYHALNCGLRIPPSAGSASGVLPNPVGYNRVYVHTGPDVTYERWFEGLRVGRSFVTNGPLLRCRANGRLPGEVFKAAAGETIEIEVDAKLNSRDSIPAVEIVRDGRVVRSVPLAADGQSASLGKLSFAQSGWFLVRAIASKPETFRFASSAPFYVEVGAKPRVSKSSARFFLDWVAQGITRVRVDDPEQRGAVLEFHRAAEKFWRDKVEQANAE